MTTRYQKISKAIAKVILSLLAILLIPDAVLALEKTDYIDTNRPSFMFSPLVVPRSSVQLESGTLYQRFQHRRNSFDIPETQVRVGLLTGTEFQMFVPQYLLLTSPHNPDSVVTGLEETGIKQKIGPFKKLDLSVIASMNIPTHTRRFTGQGVQPVFRVPWGYPVTKSVSIMGMQSLLLLNSGRTLQYQPFVMLNKTWGTKFTTFAEYAGFFTDGDFPVNIAHFGGEYRFNRHSQIDCHFGFGLNSAAPTAFIGAGYSYRFDKLSW